MDRISVKRNLVKYRGLDFDYTLVGYDKEEKEIVKNIKIRLKTKLLPEIKIFKDFKILFGQVSQGLGLYINGSCFWKPTFIIDLDNIIKYGNDFDIPFATIIEETILHELGHAIQDINDMFPDEDEAENFANNYFNDGLIDDFWIYNSNNLK